MCQVGFPGETFDEAVDTLAFLRDNMERAPFVSLAQFALERGAIIFQNPWNFGITVHPQPPDEDLSWMYRYTREDGIDSNDAALFFEEAEGALDRIFPDRDLFFKGGLGHAHTSLYTSRYPPETFIAWNRRPLRQPPPLEETMALRSARGLAIRAEDNGSLQAWSRLVISSLETPELTVAADGSVLLLLLAALDPVPFATLANWVLRLSGGQYSRGHAREMVQELYESGLLLAASGDRRAAAF
jgi:hypothetical protein